MITTSGRDLIKRYLAGYVPSIAQSIAFGIGGIAENMSQTSLQLEVARNTINLTSYDFANDKLVWKASIPDDYVGQIYEVGIYSLPANTEAGNYGSRIVTTFDSATETWVDPADGVTPAVFDTANMRVGVDALLQTPAAGATATYTLRDLQLDFSGNSASDTFIFAFYCANPNANSVSFKFMTDAANYYTFTITTPAQSAGYKIVEIQKGAAVTTGVPDWENITELQATTTSKAGAAAAVSFDAIRIEDRDSLSLDYVLVARKVLSPPVAAVDGLAQDIEFSMDVQL